MKLLYIFFDFTQNGEKSEGYRGYKTCELNFGTQSIFHMEPPGQDRPAYLLTREERAEGEKIVPGFWGNDRIYNISALVGDNGSGKSMLIHEIIRCLMTSFHKRLTFEKLEEPQYPFVFITENVDGELYLVNFHIVPDVSGFPKEWKRISLPIDQNGGRSIVFNWGLDPPKPRREYGVFRQTKMIYFSNAITMADKAQSDYWNYYDVTYSNGYSVNSQYTSPMYDCSLITDMSEALKISKSGENTIDKHLSTYFNFRSYQEARYVFDRTQRKILLEMRDTYNLPVPLPKLLKLSINNPPLMNAIPNFKSSTERNSIFFKYYNNNFFSSNAQRLAAALSINCVLAYCTSENKQFFEDVWSKFTIANESMQNNTFFSNLLICCNDTSQRIKSDYFEMCLSYITFLWSHVSVIDRYFKFYSIDLCGINDISVEIPLGDIIDPPLEEFMIQFVNLTRAVSKYQYFVIYNWGLSSGESNLLHMFTKLRYALSGTIFDKTKNHQDNAKQAGENIQKIKREEKLLTTTDNQTMHDCDSVILFIDEADLTYHPEWQRQFISIITHFLPKIYTDPYYNGSGSGCKEIQIILSTHSPLILGDFPSASVSYLWKNINGTNQIDNNRQPITFGENLYTILKDSFYLRNGAVGEFARRKINQVIKETSEVREEARNKNAFHSWTNEDFNLKLNNLDDHEKKTVRYLAHGIIRSKLEEEIVNCRRILHCANNTESPETAQGADYRSRIHQLEREKDILEQRIEALRQKLEASE